MSDFERPLNKRGRQAAALLGRTLADLGFAADAVYSSSSRRTRETLAILLPLIGLSPAEAVFEKDLYLASAALIIEKVRALEENHETVLFCGHNPGIEEAAEILSGGPWVSFPTCALMRLQFSAKSWRDVGAGCVAEKSFWYP
jgi:phosphohistidine phosphatase